MHGRKMYKIHEMALDMGVPIIGLNDSPGARVIKPDMAGSDDPLAVPMTIPWPIITEMRF